MRNSNLIQNLITFFVPRDKVRTVTDYSIIVNDNTRITYCFVDKQHLLFIYSDDENLNDLIRESSVFSEFTKFFICKEKSMVLNGGS